MNISHESDRTPLFLNVDQAENDVIVADAFDLPDEDASDEAEEYSVVSDAPRRRSRDDRDESVISEYIEDPTDPAVINLKTMLLVEIDKFHKKNVMTAERPDATWTTAELNSLLQQMKTRVSMARANEAAKALLCGLAYGTEMAVGKIEPFGMNLDGWGARVFAEKEMYEDVLGELYMKYAADIATPPEMKLALMLLMSAAMHKAGMAPGTSFDSFISSTMPNVEQPQQPQAAMRPPTLSHSDLLNTNAFTPSEKPRRRRRGASSIIMDDEEGN